MLKTAELPEIVVKHTCPGCMRSLPFTLEHFAFCLLCGSVFCRKCMRACVLCQRERCYICFEHIADQQRTSGEICEKCATLLIHQGRRQELQKIKR